METPTAFPFKAQPEDLLPRARAKYEQLVAKEGEKLPILVTGTHIAIGKDDGDPMIYADTDYPAPLADGSYVTGKFINVGDEAIRWDEAFVRRFHMSPDSAYMQPPYANASVVAAIHLMAEKKGILPLPIILQGEKDQGDALQSREGTNYILLDPTLPPAEAIAIAAHEKRTKTRCA